MIFKKTMIEGVIEFVKSSYVDERGSFERLFDSNIFKNYLSDENVVQSNLSLTKDIGTVRGLHLQMPPHSEIKIIQALKGKVLDIALDLRRGSPTFLKHVKIELKPGNGVILPKGVAHGFQVLEENSEMLYFHSQFYKPEFEKGFNLLDPRFGIDLPLPVQLISIKDANYSLISNSFEGI